VKYNVLEESEEKEKVVGETEKPKDPPEAHETPAEPTGKVIF
jgi:hypothetical protein